MTFFQALILALVQGLTEFLPVSSSGHLALFQHFFKLQTAPIAFDVFLHLGTLGAVFVFFRKVIFELIIHWRKKITLWRFLIIGSIPAALFGFFLESQVETTFGSLTFVGLAWIFFSFLLISTKFIKKGNKIKTSSFDALVIGVFQAVALFPGISRSGSTIVGGIYRGLSPELAFRYSFLLAIPAVLGAVLLETKTMDFQGIDFCSVIFSMALAGLVGWLALVLLHKILKSEKFYLFGFYCLVLGLAVLFFQ